MNVYVLGLILGWLISAPIVGTIVGRAIAIADRREAAMRLPRVSARSTTSTSTPTTRVNLVAADSPGVGRHRGVGQELRASGDRLPVHPRRRNAERHRSHDRAAAFNDKRQNSSSVAAGNRTAPTRRTCSRTSRSASRSSSRH